VIDALALICAILDDHGLEWEFDPNYTDGSGSIFLKNRDDIINVGYKSLEIVFFADYFTWRKEEASLKVCLFDSGSGKLIERYVRYIRGPIKKEDSQT
tara:strand:+ start:12220 stop:12513 length:294 start_codon:yes stop_codon:yes gene_type:complete